MIKAEEKKFSTGPAPDKLFIDLNLSDLEIINNYLQNVEKTSHNELKAHKSVIYRALNYLNKNLDDIDSLTMFEYFRDVIDKLISTRGKNKGKNISLRYKEQIRVILRSFFNYILKNKLNQRIHYTNPVPTKSVYDFNVNSKDIKNPLNEEEDSVIFTDEELLDILSRAEMRAKGNSKIGLRDFIIFSLLTACGMRIMECLSIRIEHIDLQNRFITTGYEKDARKSTKRKKEGLLFFIPRNLVPYLEKYIYNIKQKSRGWLFPGRNSFYKSFYQYTMRNYGKKFANFHSFRKSLITRLDDQPGMQPHIREILLNHTPTTTQGISYIKKSKETKKRDYDKYFPYYHFPWF